MMGSLVQRSKFQARNLPGHSESFFGAVNVSLFPPAGIFGCHSKLPQFCERDEAFGERFPTTRRIERADSQDSV
jgi:hypothetical protein